MRIKPSNWDSWVHLHPSVRPNNSHCRRIPHGSHHLRRGRRHRVSCASCAQKPEEKAQRATEASAWHPDVQQHRPECPGAPTSFAPRSVPSYFPVQPTVSLVDADHSRSCQFFPLFAWPLQSTICCPCPDEPSRQVSGHVALKSSFSFYDQFFDARRELRWRQPRQSHTERSSASGPTISSWWCEVPAHKRRRHWENWPLRPDETIRASINTSLDLHRVRASSANAWILRFSFGCSRRGFH